MILVIDAGNTNITIGAYLKDDLQFVARLSTNRDFTQDQFAINLKNIFSLNGFLCSDFKGAAISSVVPDITIDLKNAVKKLIGKDPVVLGPGIKTGLDIRIDNPALLGTDLVAGAVAAVNNYPLPCIIADLGTATKVSVINEKGAFLGCTISPGLQISLSALSSYASQLPFISLDKPTHVVGTNSIDSMRAGTIYGTADMLDGMCARIEKELSLTAKSIIATGGLAGDVVVHCKRNFIINNDLLLHGLKTIYDKNS